MFFQVDDQFQVNPKQLALAERVLTARSLDGFAALGLWTVAGSRVQAQLSDGVVTRVDLLRIALDLTVAEQLAHLLVDAGLWHAPGHDCDRCEPVNDGTWRYHDWWDLRYERGEQVKVTVKKRQELKDQALINAIWARDSLPGDPTTAPCRYCGHHMKRADKKSERRPWPDHVDPTKAIGARNVVLACQQCNQHKGRRTPEQAGMTLRPAPPHPRTAGPSAGPSAGRSPATTAAAGRSQGTQGPLPGHGRPTGQEAAPAVTAPPGSLPPITGDITTDRSPKDAVPLHAGARARARQGQGGVTPGSPTGSPQGQPGTAAPGRPRRRRRRGGSTPSSRPADQPAPGSTSAPPPQSGQGLAPEHDAGPAPMVPTAGVLGSPWRGWRGPPSTVTDTTCDEHGQEMPCRVCLTSRPEAPLSREDHTR